MKEYKDGSLGLGSDAWFAVRVWAGGDDMRVENASMCDRCAGFFSLIKQLLFV